jgi:uncharacterized protein (TIGR02246 family)
MSTSDKTKDETAIRELDVQWGDAASKHDLDTVLEFYAHDGSLVWPGFPPAHGAKAIREQWAKMIVTPGLFLRFVPERIVIAESGDLATDFGRVEMAQDTPKGKEKITAKYLVAWRKENGVWKVLYDSWNMDS